MFTSLIVRQTATVPILLLALVALAGATGGPLMAQSPDQTQPATITVSATGNVIAVPDIALISVGVVSEADTARDALNTNSRAMVGVIESLREAGLQTSDIQTTDFSVQPRYVRDRNESGAARIEGYRVQNSVRIRVRDLKKLGDILDVVVSDGSNQIGNIQFDLSEAEALRDKARVRAVEEATRKARTYASAAGVSLGPVKQIQEQGGGHQPRVAMMRTAAAESVPIEAGETTVSVGVTMTWELQ